MTPLFDSKGWRIPQAGYRTFSRSPKYYYQFGEFNDIENAHRQYLTYYAEECISKDLFESTYRDIISGIKEDPEIANLCEGVCLPFFIPKGENGQDLGASFDHTLSKLEGGIFKPNNLPFKVSFQHYEKLKGQIDGQACPRLRGLYSDRATHDIVGAYFPNALLEYDVATQRLQMDGLSRMPTMCLNGFLDTISVLIGHPKMYLNSDKYSPITILSGEKLSDERFILCLKSYGLQTEFWCLSQKLTEDTYQVSEQWTAGISVYCCV